MKRNFGGVQQNGPWTNQQMLERWGDDNTVYFVNVILCLQTDFLRSLTNYFVCRCQINLLFFLNPFLWTWIKLEMEMEIDRL